MGRALLIVIPLVLAIYALIDCLQAPPQSVRGMRKPLWLLTILIPVAGALAWLVAGRPRTPRRRQAPRRPVAPDDNPEFLRQMRSLDEEHEQLLRQWERDLKRRERQVGPTGTSNQPNRPRPAAKPADGPGPGATGPGVADKKGDKQSGGPANGSGPLGEPAAEPPGDEPQSA